MKFSFLYRDVPHVTSNGAYISQAVRFSRACNNINDFSETVLAYKTSFKRKPFCRYQGFSQEYNLSSKSQPQVYNKVLVN